MTPTPDYDALDQLIESQLAGDASRLGIETDPETTSLLATVRELRQLATPPEPDADFPSRAAEHIAARLRARSSRVTPQESANGLEGAEERVRGMRGSGSLAVAVSRRPWWREGMRIAAAAIALVVVTALLAVVLRGQGASTQIGGRGRAGGISAFPPPSQFGQTVSAPAGNGLIFAIQRTVQLGPYHVVLSQLLVAPDVTYLDMETSAPDYARSIQISLRDQAGEKHPQTGYYQVPKRGDPGVVWGRVQYPALDLASREVTIHLVDTTVSPARSVDVQVPVDLSALRQFAQSGVPPQVILDGGQDLVQVYQRGLGQQLNLLQQADGFVVILKWAYADGQHIVLYYTVSGPPDHIFTAITLVNPSLTDGSGHTLSSRGGSGVPLTNTSFDAVARFDVGSAKPAHGVFTLHFAAPAFQATEVSTQDASGVPNRSFIYPPTGTPAAASGLPGSSNSVSVRGPFGFDFTVPVQSTVDSSSVTPPIATPALVATMSAGPGPRLPVAQSHAVWQQVAGMLGQTVSPILRPQSLPAGLDQVRLYGV